MTLKININKYDKIWSQKVRERDGACLYCGRREYLQAHHLFGRANSATRFDLTNGFTLCPACHTFNNEFSAHRTPDRFKAWAKDFLGEEVYTALERKANSIMSRDKATKEFINLISQLT